VEKKILECSSAGDKRFSALHAIITVFNMTKTIEDHYQQSKLFNYNNKLQTFKDFRFIKKIQHLGYKPKGILIANTTFDVTFLTQWYYSLWYKYLTNNPQLAQYASSFDDFTDKFSKNSSDMRNISCNAIRMFVKQKKKMRDMIDPLWQEFFELGKVMKWR
jgi:hypothetical protein